MLFLYSGADVAGNSQTSPSKSLGGYCSNTIIPNRLGNLFSILTPSDLVDKRMQTYGIFLQNNDNATHTNVKFYYIYNNSVFNLQVAAVNVDVSQSIEKIGSPYDSPYYATFYQANAAYANGELIILTPPNTGDIITVMGVSTAAMSQSTPTIENLVDAIVLAYTSNPDFKCIKVNASTIQFIKIIIGIDDSLISFSTTGVGSASVSYLSGGIDNSVTLSSSMAAGVLIGLWLQLSVNDDYSYPTDDDIYNDTDLINEMINSLELHLDWS